MLPDKVMPKLERWVERLKEWRYAVVAPVGLEVAETMEQYRRPPKGLKYRPRPRGRTLGRGMGLGVVPRHHPHPKILRG
jgi:hypothetical protein